jgi:AcrR family transcriptional regulator
MATTLRADAERNRERILEAARRSFAEDGLDIGVDEIARRAGVGIGTLYRRFPTKASLVEAIFEDRLDTLQPAIDHALAADDPWEALAELIHVTVARQADDHGFGQMVVLRLGPDAVPARIRRRFFGPLEELLARAQRAGVVRRDVIADDLPAIVRMAGASALGAASPDDCRRHVELLLDGLRPH